MDALKKMAAGWLIVGFAAAMAVVTACTSVPASSGDGDSTQSPTPLPVPIDISVITEAEVGEFLTTTEAGEAVQLFLDCVDLDCHDSWERLRTFGSQPLPYLLYLLENNPPAGTKISYTPQNLLQARIVGSLGLSKDIRALEPLLSQIDHPNRLVRSALTHSLIDIDNGDAVLSALLVLLKDSDSLVREDATKALTALGRAEAISALQEALQAESQEHIRIEIQEAIRILEILE
ncbi:MAG: HEAT repeat domain-containing protein [Chloroflexi bacterium]|nr:HEAT repeat domain-containing protein [Chloroflexota bacterium]